MGKNKKWIILILFVLLASFFTESTLLGAESTPGLGNSIKSPPANDRIVPVIELPTPMSEPLKKYLGLSGTGNFKIGQIKAEVLIIEAFSFYCPHCQRSAAKVNDFFELLQGRSDLKGKIKLIGIGTGNSLYEVDSFRKRYNVPFPLFPDAGMEISQKLRIKGTPTFIGLRLTNKGVQEQFYFAAGGFQESQTFLDEMIQLSGMN